MISFDEAIAIIRTAARPLAAETVALEKAGLSHDEAVKLDAQEVPAEPIHSDRLRAR